MSRFNNNTHCSVNKSIDRVQNSQRTYVSVLEEIVLHLCEKLNLNPDKLIESAIEGKKFKTTVSEESEKIDEAGLMKLTRLGKAYDRARIGSRGLSNPENKKRLGDAYFSMRDKWLKKREDRIKSGNYSSLGKHTSVLAAAARARRERKKLNP